MSLTNSSSGATDTQIDSSKLTYDDAKSLPYREKARKASSANKHAAARDAYREALKHNPLDEASHAFLSEALYKLGDNKGAFEAAKTSLELNPHYYIGQEKFTMALRALGRSEPMPKVSVSLELNRPPEVEVLYAALDLRRSANQAYTNRDLNDACIFFKASLALVPTDEYSQSNLPQALCQCGEMAEAEWQSIEMCRKWPTFFYGPMSLATVLAHQERYVEAVEVYRKAASLAPSAQERAMLMGNIGSYESQIKMGRGRRGKPPTGPSARPAIKAQNEKASRRLIAKAAMVGYAGAFEAAIIINTAAIKLDPSFLFGYFNRAQCYGTLGDYVASAKDLAECAKIDPSCERYAELACDYTMVGDFTSALEALKIGKKLGGHLIKQPFISFFEGVQCILSQLDTLHSGLSEADARKELADALTETPSNIAALIRRSLVQSVCGDHDAAIADATEAVRLDPSQDAAHVRLSHANIAHGKYAEAVDALSKIPDAQTKLLDTLEGGGVTIAEGAHSEIIHALETFIDRFKNRYKLPSIMAEGYASIVGHYLSGDYTTALLAIKGYSIAQQEVYKVFYMQGQSLMRLGRYQEAAATALPLAVEAAHSDDEREIIDKMTAEATRNVRAGKGTFSSADLRQRGNSELKDNDMVGAIQSYTAAIEVDPSDELAYSNRAMVQSKLGNHKAAAEDASACIKLKPRFWKGHYRLGSALMALGQFESAKESFTAALGFSPGEAERAEITVSLNQCEGMADDSDDPFDTESSVTNPNEDVSKEALSEAKSAAEDLETKPHEYLCQWRYAKACIAIGRLEDAVEAFEYSLHVAPAREQAAIKGELDTCQINLMDRQINRMLKETGMDLRASGQLNIKANLDYRSRGHKARAKADKKEALDMYSKALECYPFDVISLRNRAEILNDIGRHDDAHKDASTCQKVGPKYGAAYEQLSEALFGLDRKKEGISVCKEYFLLALTDRRRLTIRMMIQSYQSENQKRGKKAPSKKSSSTTTALPKVSKDEDEDKPQPTKRAKAVSESVPAADAGPVMEVLDITGLSPELAATTYRLKGDSTLVAEGSVKMAKTADGYYTRALELNPRDELAFCNRSLARWRMGMHTESAKDAAECVKITPYNVKGHFRLGMARMELGQVKEAAKTFTNAVGLLQDKSTDKAEIEAYIRRCEGKKGPLSNNEQAANNIKWGLSTIVVEGEYPLLPLKKEVAENTSKEASKSDEVPPSTAPISNEATTTDSTIDLSTINAESSESKEAISVTPAPPPPSKKTAATNNAKAQPQTQQQKQAVLPPPKKQEQQPNNKPQQQQPPKTPVPTKQTPMTTQPKKDLNAKEINTASVAASKSQQAPSATKEQTPLPNPDVGKTVRFDPIDKNQQSFLSAFGGKRAASPVAPPAPVGVGLATESSRTERAQSPTSPTSRRSQSSAPLAEQPKSRSGSAAPPRFTPLLVREQRSLIVADTCGLMSMDKAQLQSFANYLVRTGETLAIPFVVVSELDYIQKDFARPDRQYLARQAREWVRTLQEANYIRIQTGGESDASVTSLTSNITNDDHILAYAVYLKKQEEAKPTMDRRVVKLLTVDETFIIKTKGFELGVAYPSDF